MFDARSALFDIAARRGIIPSAPVRRLSPAEFAAQRLRILTKDKRLVPFTYNPVQRDLLTHLTGRDLVLKARQHGVSTAIQGLLYQAVVTGTATTMTLAHDDDSTKTLRRIADRFHAHDPQHPKRGAANDRLSTYPDHDSEALIATAGNKTSGRSTTLTHLHGSEIAFWPDAQSILASALQAGDPQAILESTPNGAQGDFYTLCMEALDGNREWTLHFYPWWAEAGYQIPLLPDEHLDYSGEELALVEAHGLTAEQIKWRRTKKAELKHQFAQEYAEDPRTCFLLSGNSYFGDVAAAAVAPQAPEYHADHRYVAGLDFGQANDFTALDVVDGTVRHEVAWLRVNRLPWAEMRRQIAVLCAYWHVGTLVAEANAMGTTNIEELERELKAIGCATTLVQFWMSNESKASLAGALHETLHQADGLKTQADPVRDRELSAFVAKQLPSMAWRLEAASNEHDDTVIARMLAWYGVLNPQGVWFA